MTIARRAGGSPGGHRGEVLGAVFSRTSRRILSYGDDGTARLWDLGVTAHLRVVRHQREGFTILDVASDGRKFVTTDARGDARIWSPDGRSRCCVPAGALEARLSSRRNIGRDGLEGPTRIWTIDGSPRQTLPHPGLGCLASPLLRTATVGDRRRRQCRAPLACPRWEARRAPAETRSRSNHRPLVQPRWTSPSGGRNRWKAYIWNPR